MWAADHLNYLDQIFYDLHCLEFIPYETQDVTSCARIFIADIFVSVQLSVEVVLQRLFYILSRFLPRTSEDIYLHSEVARVQHSVQVISEWSALVIHNSPNYHIFLKLEA